MRVSSRSGWGEFDDVGGHRPAVEAASRLLATARAVCTPANVALVGALAFGWLALIGWTGAGPDGWQARVCARLDLQPASCGAVGVAKDQSRLVPYAVADDVTR